MKKSLFLSLIITSNSYTMNKLSFNPNKDCQICYNSLQKDTHPLIVKSPLHPNTAWHYACLAQWHKKNTSCPTCRALTTSTKDDYFDQPMEWDNNWDQLGEEITKKLTSNCYKVLGCATTAVGIVSLISLILQ